jgi:uncharacterized repeat protein (TIGR03803 family)
MRIRFSLIAFAAAMLVVISAAGAHAQTYKILTKLTPTTGDATNTPLVQGTNGNLYATAIVGGANQSQTYCSAADQDHCGTLFEVTPAGKISVVYNFCAQVNCTDGGLPSAALVLGPNGNFYGATGSGGTSPKSSCQWSSGCGTIFEITPAGKLTVLYNVCSQTNCADGLGAGQLVLGTNGNFYGFTGSGGIANGDAGCPNGCGTIFEISPAGKFTTIYKFCSKLNGNGGCADGMNPIGLVLGPNGNFYGLTYYGGTNGVGNIFEVTPAGELAQIYNFCSQANCADGKYPTSPFILGNDGNFYGTTSSGGANGGGVLYAITPAGRFITQYSFCNWFTGSCPDGSAPSAPVVQGSTDGNFYGTAGAGGIVNEGLCLETGCGTAFQLTPEGQLTNLYTFCSQASCSDGAYPGALMQSTNGAFYGVANKGGRPGCTADGGCGTVWGLLTGLAPFARANPNFGKVGRVIGILGNNLTGATSVTFNGVTATFQIMSNTYIKAQVPTGATTGRIKVVTSGGILTSNVDFYLLP